MSEIEILRKSIIQQLAHTYNKKLLHTINNLMQKSNKDENFIEPSEAEKNMIAKGLEDVKAGKVYTQEEVDKMDEEWMF